MTDTKAQVLRHRQRQKASSTGPFKPSIQPACAILFSLAGTRSTRSAATIRSLRSATTPTGRTTNILLSLFHAEQDIAMASSARTPTSFRESVVRDAVNIPAHRSLCRYAWRDRYADRTQHPEAMPRRCGSKAIACGRSPRHRIGPADGEYIGVARLARAALHCCAKRFIVSKRPTPANPGARQRCSRRRTDSAHQS